MRERNVRGVSTLYIAGGGKFVAQSIGTEALLDAPALPRYFWERALERAERHGIDVRDAMALVVPDREVTP